MYPYKLPELTYSYDSLEPYIDKETMEIHYTKHHGAYVNNLNAALEKYPYLHSFCLTDLLANLRALPDDIREAVRNNGGGHLNHSLWWEILKLGGSNVPVGELANEIQKTWGSFEKFKEEFNNLGCGAGREASRPLSAICPQDSLTTGKESKNVTEPGGEEKAISSKSSLLKSNSFILRPETSSNTGLTPNMSLDAGRNISTQLISSAMPSPIYSLISDQLSPVPTLAVPSSCKTTRLGRSQ
jgi:hypothetical protein